MNDILKQASVIITAGGSGTRLSTQIKKQYIKIVNKPILYYSLKIFNGLPLLEKILVVPQEDIEYVQKNIINKFGFSDFQIAVGGITRHHSVYNGLTKLKECQYVFIHDGVRPFLTLALINDLVNKIKEKNVCAVIPCIKLKDTVKKINEKDKIILETINREEYRAVQTPQLFDFKLLLECYNKNKENLDKFTDDAGFLEKEKYIVHYINGIDKNIKITTKEDLIFAKYLLKHF